jgi:flagellar biosynthesis GTPase FlhF
MDYRNRTRPLANGQPTVVSAPTLKGAYKLVKQKFGEDAVIMGSRTVTKRQALGLGHEKMFEVMVQEPGSGKNAGTPVKAFGSLPLVETPTRTEMLSEVNRIEELVASIAGEYEKMDLAASITRDNPLAETLVTGGASSSTVEKLLTRFSSETGQPANNRVAGLSWLGDNLRASNCDWDGFYGCHAFMSNRGTGQSQFILAAAGKLQELGRRTLVLNVLPTDKGSIRQLQVEASRLGFDAAVIQKPGQLAKSEEHLSRYDVVLVDMPTLDNSLMATGGTLHSWLAGNTTFHRHMLVAATQDPRDMEKVNQDARLWNCDWLGFTRMELTGCPAKILDFADGIPLPISLVQENESVEIASSGRLLDFILGQSNTPLNNTDSHSAKG